VHETPEGTIAEGMPWIHTETALRVELEHYKKRQSTAADCKVVGSEAAELVQADRRQWAGILDEQAGLSCKTELIAATAVRGTA
jgi:hypothetical protein